LSIVNHIAYYQMIERGRALERERGRKRELSHSRATSTGGDMELDDGAEKEDVG
jgi:hypothetical protein